jgi:hypothetical protein
MGMVIGTDARNNIWDPVLTTKFPASRLTKVFFSPGDGIKPWTAPWYTTLPPTVLPHVNFKDWASDGAAIAAVNTFLDNMPAALSSAPLIPELGISMAITWFQEPEDNFSGGATEFKRRYGVLWDTVRAHANGPLVAVLAVQKYYWTRFHNSGDWSTWFPAGHVDYASIDSYNPTGTGVYDDPDDFMALLLDFRDGTGLPLWIPELGAGLQPGDTTGAGRAAWITAVTGRLAKAGCVAVSWWDGVGVEADESLSDQASIDAWASLFLTEGTDVARHPFGDTTADVTFNSDTVSGTDNVMLLAGGAEVTFWNAQLGGTQYTDLAEDAAGTSPVDHVTTSDGSDGRKAGQIPGFFGPDEIRQMWAQAASGPRQLVQATDMDQFAAQLTQMAADLQAHLANTGNPHQTTVSNLADVVITSPTNGEVLTKVSGGWANLPASIASGALLLSPPFDVDGVTYLGNRVTMPAEWANDGSGGNPFLEAVIPNSPGDTNPDFWQVKYVQVGGSKKKVFWLGGKGEARSAPGGVNSVAHRTFEWYAGSTQRYWELSTDPTDPVDREPLAGAYGTAHSTKPGWVEFTRVASAMQGVQAGGNYASLSALMIRGRRTSTGPPGSGTWAVGEMVVDSAGVPWLCTTAGTPGVWVGPNSGTYGSFADVASLAANAGHGTPHFQSRTAPGSMTELQGQLVMSGSVSAGGTLATLPSGQRPTSTQVFTLRFTGTGAATALFSIDSGGLLTCSANLVSGNTFNLDGLAFLHS